MNMPGGRRVRRWIVQGAGLAATLLWATAATAQTSADLLAGWNYASNCLLCHSTPVKSSGTTNDSTDSGAYHNILKLYLLSPPWLGNDASVVGPKIQNLCGTSTNRTPHTDARMCTESANSGYLSRGDDEGRAAAYQLLFAARHGLVTATAGAQTKVIRPSGTPNDETLAFDGATAQWNLTLENLRSAPMGFAFSNPQNFTIVGDPNCANNEIAAATFDVAAACTVGIRFTPSTGASGTVTATLDIVFEAKVSSPSHTAPPAQPTTRRIALTGVVVAANATFTPAATTAFSTTVNSTHLQQVGEISNGGNAQLKLGTITFSTSAAVNPYALPDAATVPGSCQPDKILLAGERCPLYVAFTPRSPIAYPGNIRIEHDGVNTPTTAANAFQSTGLQGTLEVTLQTPFGTVDQGRAATGVVKVANTGGATLTGLSYPIPPGGGEFGFDTGNCATTLASGSVCELHYTFRPSTAANMILAPGATRNSTLAVAVTSTNASNSPQTLTLTGTARGLQNPSATTPPSFAPTPVGSTNPTRATVTLTNPRANDVVYRFPTAGAIAGTDAADFEVESQSCATSRRVTSATPCTFTIRYTPTVAALNRDRSASLELILDPTQTDPAPPALSIALRGGATTSPTFSVPSHTITISSAIGGSTPDELTISNPGTAPLVLQRVALASGGFPGDYTLGGTCVTGASIPGRVPPAAASTCRLAVTFTPGAEGPRAAAITIEHNASGSPETITLAGTGTPALGAVLDVAGTVAFGDVLQGASASRSLTVRNGNTTPGATALVLNDLRLEGVAKDDYTRGGDCAAATSLAPGRTCTVTLTFAPRAAGARAATLEIGSSAGSRSVSLGGTGVALENVRVTPDAAGPFPPTLMQTTSSATRTVTLVNPRANAVGYTATLGGGQAGDFAVTESCVSRSIAAGATCTLRLSFTPRAGAAGTRSATLALAFTGSGTDPAPAPATLTVEGSALLPAPAFGIGSSALSFAAVVGAPASQSTLITNTGTAALVLGDLSIAGVGAADFALAPHNGCSAGLSLAPATNCALVLRYAPSVAGGSTATLTISHNAAGTPGAVTLSGTATAAPQGRIALGALALTFPAAQLGTPSTQTLTVQNTGDAALTFSAFTLGGSASADYARSGSCSVATPLAAGAQCTLAVTFTPSAVGSRSAALTVQSDASNGAATISLSGTGVPVPAPTAVLSTPKLEFGNQTVGGLYPARRVTLTNGGSATLSAIALEVQGAAFALAANTCGATLAVGASCSIDVAFTPAAAGAGYEGQLRVASNAEGSPHVATLLGAGIATAQPVLEWQPANTQLAFGHVVAGSVSAPQTATLFNRGPGGARITLLNAVGADAAAFSVTAGSCPVGDTPLAENDSCTLEVRFAPGSAGAKAARVQVASSGSAPAELTLGGSGLGGPSPALTLSATSLAFNGVRVGAQSLPLELRLSGSGSGVVRVTDIQASAGFVVLNKDCPPLPFTLAAGANCTVTLNYKPEAVGGSTGTLKVVSDAGATPAEVTLSGNGEPAPDVSGSGCSIATGTSAVDPTLWTLVLLAAAALGWRRHVRAARR
jgi:trimeric autotransporter adhesin